MRKNRFLLLSYAISTIVSIDFIGRLFVAEIIAIFYLPFINIKKLINKNPELKFIVSSLLVLLLSLIISDYLNSSLPQDFLRGWSLVLISLVLTIFLVNLFSKSIDLIIYYLIIIFIVKLIFGEGDLEFQQWYIDTNYFKVRFVPFLNPVIMLIGSFLYKKERIFVANILFFFYGVICLILDARSNGLIFTLSSIILFIKLMKVKFTIKKVLWIGIVSSIILYIFYVFYVNEVFSAGLGGKNAKDQLSLVSNPYNPLELLYYGRAEVFVLVEAVIDKPIFGHGSWGKDVTGKYAAIISLIKSLDKPIYREFIHAHSVFLGTWVWAGFFGFIAIFYSFFILFKYSIQIFKSIEVKNFILPIIVILSLDMLWAYFFSPIQTLRTTFPLFAALILVEYQKYKKLLNKYFRSNLKIKYS